MTEAEYKKVRNNQHTQQRPSDPKPGFTIGRSGGGRPDGIRDWIQRVSAILAKSGVRAALHRATIGTLSHK